MLDVTAFLNGVTKKRVKGAIFVSGDLLPILDANNKPMRPTMRTDAVRVGGFKKTAMMRYRPEYKDWRVVMTIRFDTGAFTAEQVVSLLNRAGFNVGVGEYRPEFGAFRVVKE